MENREGYEDLLAVLGEAYDQASLGKGKARHGHGGKAFTEQQILEGQRSYGIGFALGQADKKMKEAFHMEFWEDSRKDLLGAIVYIAGAIIFGDEEATEINDNSPEETFLEAPPQEEKEEEPDPTPPRIESPFLLDTSNSDTDRN